MRPISEEFHRSSLECIGARLAARRTEIEQMVLARVNAVADPPETGGLEYVVGLRAAVFAAVDYGLAALDPTASTGEQIPVELFAQARQAARNGIGLEIVLRRYFAGQSLLVDFLIEEAEAIKALPNRGLQQALRAEAVAFDRLIVAIAEEYSHEARDRERTTEHHRTERVKKLLIGERLNLTPLDYEFDAWHLGLVASGPGVRRSIGDLATALDRRFLLVSPEKEVVWAWLAGRSRVDAQEAERTLTGLSSTVSASLGEPAMGLAGWRLTHQQARVAFAALRGPGAVRYADVALLTAALGDEVLSASLRQLYLAPLAREPDGGRSYRKTLRAYLAAEGNVSSAAAALGVSRKTVAARLRAIELVLGRHPGRCAPELRLVLKLEEMGYFAARNELTAFASHISPLVTDPP